MLTRTSKWACDWQAAPRPLVQVGSVPESASQNKGNTKRWSWTVAEIQQGCEVLEISKRAWDLCGSGQQAQALGIYGAPRLVSIFLTTGAGVVRTGNPVGILTVPSGVHMKDYKCFSSPRPSLSHPLPNTRARLRTLFNTIRWYRHPVLEKGMAAT